MYLNRTIQSLVICIFAALNSVQTRAATDAIIAPAAKVEKLAGGFLFTEGPAVDKDGNVFFTDQPNDRIMKWDVDGKLTTFLKPCGRANGLFFDHHGNIIACADERNQGRGPARADEARASGAQLRRTPPRHAASS